MRLPRPWRTLRGRLALGFLAGLLAASAVFTLVASSLIRDETSRAAREEFDRQALAIGRIVSDQAQNAAEMGREFTSPPPEFLEALAGDGTSLYYVGLQLSPGAPQPTGGLPRIVASQVDTRRLQREGIQRLDFEPPEGGPRRLATAAPVYIGDGFLVGAVIVTRAPNRFRESLDALLSRTLIALGIGLVVALALVLWITRRITRPLQRMQAGTARVAGGDLDTSFERGGPEEVDQLAAAFNEMVRRLAERDETSRDFLMRVTHDLRTPLTAIRGHVAALSDGVVPDTQVPRSLAAIEDEAARLEALVADLLDLAKLDARRFRLDLGEVEPAEVLERAFDAAEAEAVRRGIRFERRIDPLPARLVTDGARVRQIVGNLIDNALRWTPEGGEVRLEGRARPGGGLVVVVADTGPGVPEEAQETIFEPFLSQPGPDGRTGSGLGLAISRQLARALGGDLTVESRVGVGSRFRLELPAEATQATPALVG